MSTASPAVNLTTPGRLSQVPLPPTSSTAIFKSSCPCRLSVKTSRPSLLMYPAPKNGAKATAAQSSRDESPLSMVAAASTTPAMCPLTSLPGKSRTSTTPLKRSGKPNSSPRSGTTTPWDSSFSVRASLPPVTFRLATTSERSFLYCWFTLLVAYS